LYFGRLGKKIRLRSLCRQIFNKGDSACDNVAGFLKWKPTSWVKHVSRRTRKTHEDFSRKWRFWSSFERRSDQNTNQSLWKKIHNLSAPFCKSECDFYRCF